MPTLCAEVDVFRVPHHRMKSLVHRSLRTYAETDFSDSLAPQSSLHSLTDLLDEIRKHEAIEDSFIMKRLFDRVENLPGPLPECWPKLRSEHTCVLPKISQLVAKIEDALRSDDFDVDFKAVIGATYFLVLSLYLEHIVEEEGTVMSLLLEYFESEELVDLRRLVLEEHARAMIDFYVSGGNGTGILVGGIFDEEIDVGMHSAGKLPFENCEEAWACLETSLGYVKDNFLSESNVEIEVSFFSFFSAKVVPVFTLKPFTKRG